MDSFQKGGTGKGKPCPPTPCYNCLGLAIPLEFARPLNEPERQRPEAGATRAMALGTTRRHALPTEEPNTVCRLTKARARARANCKDSPDRFLQELSN